MGDALFTLANFVNQQIQISDQQCHREKLFVRLGQIACEKKRITTCTVNWEDLCLHFSTDLGIAENQYRLRQAKQMRSVQRTNYKNI